MEETCSCAIEDVARSQFPDSPEEDGIPECFRCCVCLDFLYKPVVLACGHVSCFWCVHMAMDGHWESHCPLCRQPYFHFPSICRLLHFLLLKSNPVIYKRREKQILEEENKRGFFSPVLSDPLVTGSSGSSYCTPQNLQESDIFHDKGILICENTPDQGKNVLHIGNGLHESGIQNDTVKTISVCDVSCTLCKLLLILPVVLNCGHVYCKSCLVIPQDGILRCLECGSAHTCDVPKVCLSLDCFLEEQFPTEYSTRLENLQTKQAEVHPVDLSNAVDSDESCKDTENYLVPLVENGLEINVGVGCDSCGMFPIIGKWYRCKDCVEKIGFDLCEACYKNCSQFPGRFNQNHKSNHSFMLVQPQRLSGIVWRLVSGVGPVVVVHDLDRASENTDSAE